MSECYKNLLLQHPRGHIVLELEHIVAVFQFVNIFRFTCVNFFHVLPNPSFLENEFQFAFLLYHFLFHTAIHSVEKD